MSGPNNIDRETLDKRLKRRQFWSEAFAWLVGGGLLIEYGQEIFDCFVNWHAPSPPLIGGLLVTLGVFGEVWFSRLALNTSEELQRRADSEVSQANERAAHALERATNAEQATAEANLARIKIEEALFKPHILTVDAASEITELANGYSGYKRVDVFVYDHHIPEVLRLADSIKAVLGGVRWNAKMWVGAEPRIMGSEVTLCVAREAFGADKIAVQELAEGVAGVLRKLDIGACVTLNGFSTQSSDRPVKPLLGWGVWDSKDIAELRIQVGQRQFNSDLLTRPVTPPQA